MEKCPICGHNEFEKVYDLDDYKITQETFSLQKCTHCTLIYTVDPPLGDNIGRYYESDDYLEHSNRKNDLFSRMYGWGRDLMFGYKYGILKKLGSEKKILDIGAGSGYFLNFMRGKGYSVTGIEMSERARNHAKEVHNLDIHPDEMFHNKAFKEKFDIISLWHVMEHLYDLNQVVKRFDELLNPNGHLVIALPNYNALEVEIYKKYWNGWDVPRHLWHFSPQSLKHLMNNHGFEIERMKMMPLDPLFNTLLTNKYRQGNAVMNVLRMCTVGVMSLISGLFNVEKASSIIYVIKRKKN